MPKVLNKRTDIITKDSVYIGRPSKWGNPFPMHSEADRDKVCQLYQEWLDKNEELKQQAREELKGRDLICWCSPLACHGHILIKVANEEMKNPIRVRYNPLEDTIDHINCWSKARSELGRNLSHFANIGFEHPKHGRFASIEGYWYWLLTERKHDQFRILYGFKAKEEGKRFQRVEYPTFIRDIEEAVRLKIIQTPHLLKAFKESTLPFTHYFMVGNGLDTKAIGHWTSSWFNYYYGKLRDQLKGLINNKDLKVIVAGSRSIDNYDLVCDTINSSMFNIGEIVEGGARGVDLLGRRFAEERFIPFKEFPADWDQYQKRAGFIRNEEMAKYADVLIAIKKDKSPGTTHMVETMRKLNKPIYLIEI